MLYCGRFELNEATRMFHDVRGEVPDFSCECLDAVASSILDRAFAKLADAIVKSALSQPPEIKR